MIIGSTISHYRIDSPLGQGGMGVVYRATDLGLNRQVAIKFSTRNTSSSEQSAQLAAEARAASRLLHPNIAAIYELDQTEDGRQFFVMEFVPGRKLAEVLGGEPLESQRALDVLRAVCSALTHAHRAGVIHRDIKPANIQITADGQVKVLDFGLAGRFSTSQDRQDDATFTVDLISAEGAVAGSPGYMSPEQAAGLATDHRSDLFSLGCVLYECLTGRRPFHAAHLAEYISLLHAHNPEPPSQVNPAVPKGLDAIALRLLAKKREDRFQSADEVLAALDQPEAPPASALRRIGFNVRAIAAAALLGVSVAAGWWWWSSRTYTPKPEALNWYKQGTQAARDGTYLKASRALSEAVRLDPEFALARAHLAEAWVEMDYGGRARDEMIRVNRSSGSGSRLTHFDQLHVEAIDYLVTGEVKETIARYQQMLRLAEGAEKAAVALDLGRAYERDGQPKLAVASVRDAIRADPQSAAAHLRLGLLLRRARDHAGAETALAAAERMYQAASNVEGVTEVQYARGMLEVDREHPDAAKQILSKALESARFTGNTQQQVSILLQLATLSIRSGALDDVRQLATQAVDLARAEGVENLVSRALITLGGALFLKDKTEAEKYYTTALQVSRRNHASLTEARALLSLGSLHSSMGQPERAVTELQPAAAFFSKAGYPADAFRASILLGRTQRDAGDYDGAERVFRDLLPASVKSGSKEEQAMVHDAIGQVLHFRGQFRQALQELEASSALYSKARSATGEAYALFSRASSLWRLGDYAAAAALLAQAESSATNSGNDDLLQMLKLERWQIALSQNRFAEARALAASLGAVKTPRDQVIVKVRQALTQANTGQAALGLKGCHDALASAGAIRIQILMSNALLDCSQVALLGGDRSLAQDWAGRVLSLSRKSAQPESEWRAAAILSRAGAPSGAADAAAALARLKQQWDATDFSRYLTRPDVRVLQAQLPRMESKL